MKYIKSMHRISLFYIKTMLELILCSFSLTGIYLYIGFTSDNAKVLTHTIENTRNLLEYGMVSLILAIGIGLLMDYVLKSENIL